MQSSFLLMGTPCSEWAVPHGSDPAASCHRGNSSCALRLMLGGETVRCGNPWTFCGGNPYIQRNWKMVFAISGLCKVRPYSLPLSPSAISIPGLCGKCCCAVSVRRAAWDGPMQSLDATAGCGAQGCALQELCTAHQVPHGIHVEDARRGKKISGQVPSKCLLLACRKLYGQGTVPG